VPEFSLTPKLIVASALVFACLGALVACGSSGDTASDRRQLAGTLAFSRADPEDVLLPGDVSVPRDADLYLLRLPSGRRRQLTTGPGIDTSPAWSPDGRRLAFARTIPSVSQVPTSEIYLLDLKTGREERLTRCMPRRCYGDSEPQFSPDGKQIGFLRQQSPGGARLAFVASHGGAVHTWDLERGVRAYSGPTWRPDGGEISFAGYRRGEKLRAYLAATTEAGELRELGSCPEGRCRGQLAPAWSSTDGALAFTQLGGGAPSTVYLASEVGAMPEPIATCGERTECPSEPDFSPDGRFVAITRGDDFHGAIEVTARDGTDSFELTRGRRRDCCAAWRP
jgi:Tol biopolymer transport system component